MAAIFVYIGVNLEPGLELNSPFKWRHLKQTLNIGGSLRWSRRGIALYREGRNDYQKASVVTDDGIVSPAPNMKLQLRKREYYGGNDRRIAVCPRSNPRDIIALIR